MQPTRRQLLMGGTTLLTSGLLGSISLPPAFATNTPSADAFALRALNRLTYGATEDDLKAFKASGYESWLDAQLSRSGDETELKDRLSKAVHPISYEDGRDENGHHWKGTDEPKRPLRYLDAKPADLVKLNDWDIGMEYSERERPAREIQVASLIRAAHSPNQLHEVMVQFWHDHFSVNGFKDAGCAAYFPLHDRAIRGEALGNFGKLLAATARSPSMLFYLNNEGSRASPANENYGREILELHTLGEMNYLNDRYGDWKDVPGAEDGLAIGYIDQDVYEVARAFTGWTVADGREISDGEKAPATGEFAYVQAWHDPYQKRILGREFRANASPMADGDAVIDMLARHPGTAKFVALKLCRRLLADEPPEDLVKETADLFHALADDPQQIARTVRLIATSRAFREQPASKIKRPNEFLISLFRASGASVVAAGNAFDLLSKAGWKQFEWRPPTGHPDVASYWGNTNTLAVTTSIAFTAFEDWVGTAKIDMFGGDRKDLKTIADLAAAWSRRLLVAEPQPEFTKALAEVIGNPDDELDGDDDGRRWQARTIIAMVALTPEFMTR